MRHPFDLFIRFLSFIFLLLFNSLFLIYIGILKDLLGGIIEKPRISEVAAEGLEGGRVSEAVADPFVGNNGIVDILTANGITVEVKLTNVTLCAERDKYGNVTEIVKVMIDGRNAERAHRGNEH